MPDEAEVLGLLALMLLTESRRAGPDRPGREPGAAGRARTGAAGTAGSSPRGRRWCGSACAAASRARTRSRRPSTRCTLIPPAPGAPATDWGQILQLYDQLLAVAPSPVVALNRAVAVAEVDGPAAALALVDELGAAAGQGCGPSLAGYYLFHAIRADLLRRLGRAGEAAAAYDAALARTGNAAEQDFLRHQQGRLPPLVIMGSYWAWRPSNRH